MDPIEAEFQKRLEEVKNDPKIVARGAISLIVSSCASAVTGIIIHTLVPKDALSKKQKVQLTVAAWAMGGAAAKRASYWAAHDSLTSTILCTIADRFKKSEEKTETPVEEKIEEEGPTT